jgi:hypothetical protein
LQVGDTAVDDEGLRSLSGMRLATLDLRGTRITDAGLVHLTTVRDPERVNLERTAVTDAGIEAFRRRLASPR